jgi:hypothetical protein
MAISPIPIPRQAKAAPTVEDTTEPPSTSLSIETVLSVHAEPKGLTPIVIGKSNDELQSERIAAEKKAELDRIEAARAEQQRLQREKEAEQARIAAQNAYNAAKTAQNAPQRVMASESSNSSSIRDFAHQKVAEKWGEGNWSAFDAIVTRESGWNVNAVNASSGACGLGQALPCSKMGDRSAEGQVLWVISYIEGRYGTPNAAWGFWQANNWY